MLTQLYAQWIGQRSAKLDFLHVLSQHTTHEGGSGLPLKRRQIRAFAPAAGKSLISCCSDLSPCESTLAPARSAMSAILITSDTESADISAKLSAFARSTGVVICECFGN